MREGKAAARPARIHTVRERERERPGSGGAFESCLFSNGRAFDRIDPFRPFRREPIARADGDDARSDAGDAVMVKAFVSRCRRRHESILRA